MINVVLLWDKLALVEIEDETTQTLLGFEPANYKR